MKPVNPVGIVGYGAYIPLFRVKAAEVARVWGGGEGGLPIDEKAVPGLDEDVISMSIEAARNALKRAQINPKDLGAVWVGSESHPYAVKPSSTLVAEALDATPLVSAADWQFACKAGTEAMQAGFGYIGSGMVRYALAIGADTAQGRPGDALEYTAGAGAAAGRVVGRCGMFENAYHFYHRCEAGGGATWRRTAARSQVIGITRLRARAHATWITRTVGAP